MCKASARGDFSGRCTAVGALLYSAPQRATASANYFTALRVVEELEGQFGQPPPPLVCASLALLPTTRAKSIYRPPSLGRVVDRIPLLAALLYIRASPLPLSASLASRPLVTRPLHTLRTPRPCIVTAQPHTHPCSLITVVEFTDHGDKPKL